MEQKEKILALVADIVSAYVGNNQLAPEELPALIQSVYTGMVDTLHENDPHNVENLVPAVPVEDSINDDYIICLEDGQKYKSLKRHLRTKFELTPKAYREKWGLPTDYPMVAKNYSIERSRLAKRTGLGKSI
ncbi:MAG: transcriptional regulator [Robiginitomaculum sp.]|nr:MAG: transcriptional regulator [Robiginitomaculum sp.]